MFVEDPGIQTEWSVMDIDGERLKGTDLGSAPASSSISTTPSLASSFSSFTARCSGVSPSIRFLRSTSVPGVVEGVRKRASEG